MVDKKIMNYDFISSQKDTWNRLVRISESSNIANAYLFSGPAGSGKEGLALMLLSYSIVIVQKMKFVFNVIHV